MPLQGRHDDLEAYSNRRATLQPTSHGFPSLCLACLRLFKQGFDAVQTTLHHSSFSLLPSSPILSATVSSRPPSTLCRSHGSPRWQAEPAAVLRQAAHGAAALILGAPRHPRRGGSAPLARTRSSSPPATRRTSSSRHHSPRWQCWARATPALTRSSMSRWS